MNDDDLLQIVLNERKENNLSLNKLADYGKCYCRTMASYIHKERQMPICTMLDTLQALGYTITISK